MEMARCLLLQSELPPSLWGEAVNTANYLRNRCHSKSLNGKTPYEVWKGELPDVSHFCEFGCRVLIMNRSGNRGKFDDKCKSGHFVGYSEQTKGYRIWTPEEGRVILSRDVKFFEDVENQSKNFVDVFPDMIEDNLEEDLNKRNPKCIDVEMIVPTEDFGKP